MAPTLNKPAAAGQATVERLLMRLLRAPLLRMEAPGWGVADSRSVFVGDVVAFQSPVSPASRNLLVRRVAAIEGQELVADDPPDTSYTLPAGAALACASSCVRQTPLQLWHFLTTGPLLPGLWGRTRQYVQRSSAASA